jgi:hypothetical protein
MAAHRDNGHPVELRGTNACVATSLGICPCSLHSQKFLINRQGVVVSRWGAAVDPQTMAPQIEALLAEPYP